MLRFFFLSLAMGSNHVAQLENENVIGALEHMIDVQTESVAPQYQHYSRTDAFDIPEIEENVESTVQPDTTYYETQIAHITALMKAQPESDLLQNFVRADVLMGLVESEFFRYIASNLKHCPSIQEGSFIAVDDSECKIEGTFVTRGDYYLCAYQAAQKLRMVWEEFRSAMEIMENMMAQSVPTKKEAQLQNEGSKTKNQDISDKEEIITPIGNQHIPNEREKLTPIATNKDISNEKEKLVPTKEKLMPLHITTNQDISVEKERITPTEERWNGISVQIANEIERQISEGDEEESDEQISSGESCSETATESQLASSVDGFSRQVSPGSSISEKVGEHSNFILPSPRFHRKGSKYKY